MSRRKRRQLVPSASGNNRIRVRGVRRKPLGVDGLSKAYSQLAKTLITDLDEELAETRPTDRDYARSAALTTERLVEFKTRTDAERAALEARIKDELEAIKREEIGQPVTASVGFERLIDAPPLANFAADGWQRLARFCFAQIGVSRQLEAE